MVVIPSEAKNLSSIYAREKKERFVASLGMTEGLETFFRNLMGLHLAFFGKKPTG